MLVVAAMGCAAGGSAFAQAPKPQENPANWGAARIDETLG